MRAIVRVTTAANAANTTRSGFETGSGEVIFEASPATNDPSTFPSPRHFLHLDTSFTSTLPSS